MYYYTRHINNTRFYLIKYGMQRRWECNKCCCDHYYDWNKIPAILTWLVESMSRVQPIQHGSPLHEQSTPEMLRIMAVPEQVTLVFVVNATKEGGKEGGREVGKKEGKRENGRKRGKGKREGERKGRKSKTKRCNVLDVIKRFSENKPSLKMSILHKHIYCMQLSPGRITKLKNNKNCFGCQGIASLAVLNKQTAIEDKQGYQSATLVGYHEADLRHN